MARARDTACSTVLPASGLADILAVDRHTVSGPWVDAGCPVVDGEGGRAFNVADVVRWLLAREKGAGADGYAADEARKMAAEADLAEMKRDRQRGDLVDIGAVAARVADDYSVVRTRLLALPAALAMVVQHDTDLQSLERTIKVRIVEALEQLSAPGGEWGVDVSTMAEDDAPDDGGPAPGDAP